MDDTRETTDSQESTDTTDGPLTAAIRTVTPPYVSRRDAEMDALAWGTLGLVIVLLFPFLPILAAVWGLMKLIELLAENV